MLLLFPTPTFTLPIPVPSCFSFWSKHMTPNGPSASYLVDSKGAVRSVGGQSGVGGCHANNKVAGGSLGKEGVHAPARAVDFVLGLANMTQCIHHLLDPAPLHAHIKMLHQVRFHTIPALLWRLFQHRPHRALQCVVVDVVRPPTEAIRSLVGSGSDHRVTVVWGNSSPP